MTSKAAWFLRIAGLNGMINGLGFGGFAIPAIVSVSQGHGIIYTFGNPFYGNGPFGVPTTVPMLAGFIAACAVQAAGGVLLLWPRLLRIVVSLAGICMPVRAMADRCMTIRPGNKPSASCRATGILLGDIGGFIEAKGGVGCRAGPSWPTNSRLG